MNSNQTTQNTQAKPRSCLSVVGAGTALFLGLIVLYFGFWAAGAFLVIADPVKESDAAVALSGGELDRVHEAANLYLEQTVNTLILTETGKEIPELGSKYITLLKGEALRMGVPGNAILVTERKVSSTQDEARAVRELMEKSDLSSCIVVTDPYHSFRTRLIFRSEFKGSGLSVRVHPVSGSWYRSNTWWLSAAGWEATVSEYIKLGAYFLRIQDSDLPGWVRSDLGI